MNPELTKAQQAIEELRPNNASLRPETLLSSSSLERNASESWLRPNAGLNCQPPQLPSLQVPPLAMYL